MDSLLERAADVEFLAVLSRFRLEFHGCLRARGDELFELADAVLSETGLKDGGCSHAATVHPPTSSTGAAADDVTPHHGTSGTVITLGRDMAGRRWPRFMASQT